MTQTNDQGAPTAEQLADAQAAYAAYGQTTGGLNFRGEPMPDWDGLGETIQRAWIAAADAVRRRATPTDADAAHVDPPQEGYRMRLEVRDGDSGRLLSTDVRTIQSRVDLDAAATAIGDRIFPAASPPSPLPSTTN